MFFFLLIYLFMGLHRVQSMTPRKAPGGQTALDYARRSNVNGSHAEAAFASRFKR